MVIDKPSAGGWKKEADYKKRGQFDMFLVGWPLSNKVCVNRSSPRLNDSNWNQYHK